MSESKHIFCRCDTCKTGRAVRLADREGNELVIKRNKYGKTHEVRIPLDKNIDSCLSSSSTT